jgi:hypothetical protein
MTAAQKTAKLKFKQAIAYRQKTGVTLKEAFAHIYGKKVGVVKKKAAPKKKVAKKVVKKVAKKIGYSKIRLDQEKGITKVLKNTPRTLFPYTAKEKIVKAGKKYFDEQAKKISGTNSGMYVRISPVGYVYASNILTKSTMGLRKWLQDNVGKFIQIDTSYLFNNQYNTMNSYRIYDTMIDAIKGDVRKKGKPYGVSSEPEEIAFLDWGGVKPQILPNIPDKKFGSYQFESSPSLNYHRFRNARQTINFIYSNGKYYVSNGIGYKSHNKIASTYSGNTIPAKVKNDLDKYLKQYY